MAFWFRSRFKKKKKPEELDDPLFPSESKKSKHNAVKVVIDWIKFMSKLEASFYEFLRDEPRVRILELQPRFLLQSKYQTKDGRKIRAIEYISDFRVDVEGDLYIIDAKWQETTDFKLKRKIFEKRYPDDVLIVCKTIKELRIAIL